MGKILHTNWSRWFDTPGRDMILTPLRDLLPKLQVMPKSIAIYDTNTSIHYIDMTSIYEYIV